MNRIRKISNILIHHITGKTEEIELEHIHFNSLLFSALFISFVSSIFNFIENLGAILTGFTVFSFLVLAFLYYMSRFKNRYNIWITAIVIMLLLSVFWFMNGGAIGSVPYIYLLSIILFVITARHKDLNGIFYLFLLNLSLLYILEYFFGNNLVHRYPDSISHYNDMVFVFIIVFLCIFSLTRFIKRLYNDEKNMAQEQKKIIEQKNDDLLSSLTYASYIQKKIISDENQMHTLFNDYFVLFQPKDIVSGDFYWIKEKGKYGIVVAADCTGHGVPAAFLSILGISLFEEIIKQEGEDLNPGYFLEKFRLKFIAHLQKNNFNAEQIRDGIDMGICIVSYEDGTFQFSGANRPMIMVRHNRHPTPPGYSEKETAGDYTLYSYKSTKNTIGFNYKEASFINHVIDFYPDDTFYVFSDGYGDQFNFLNRKKFTLGKFKKELLKLQELPLPAQEEYLINLHKKWRGETKQTDDILVIGMRL